MNDEFEILLEERMRRLRGPDPVGDWLDVRRRARRARRRALALAAAVALLVAVPTVAFGSRLLDVLGVTASDETVPTPSNAAPVPHVHGDFVFIPGRSPSQLAMPVLAPLLGQEEALAVPAAGWTDLVYHAWDGRVGSDESGGTPLLRRVDLLRDTRVGRSRSRSTRPAVSLTCRPRESATNPRRRARSAAALGT
jgi:hypothetical protein